uniref:(northern house mosquito) hypothetical protein n=1 Tax=Culex pipiens TaxID=7175 RepID=A0A8D8P0U2_CULPI
MCWPRRAVRSAQEVRQAPEDCQDVSRPGGAVQRWPSSFSDLDRVAVSMVACWRVRCWSSITRRTRSQSKRAVTGLRKTGSMNNSKVRTADAYLDQVVKI